MAMVVGGTRVRVLGHLQGDLSKALSHYQPRSYMFTELFQDLNGMIQV